MNQQRFWGLSIAAALLAVPAISTAIQAQTRINDLQRSSQITIAGEVVRSVGNSFVLSDGSGEVIVDAGPRWWREISLAPGEQVSITGEVGRAGEFDASSITRADGSVIEIRSPEGPPPWAGGSKRRQIKSFVGVE